MTLASLGSVIRLQYGKPLDCKDRKANGRFPVYGANGEKDRSDNFYCDKPSIIVGRKGSAGELRLTEDKFWPLDVTYFVEFDDRRNDLKFLFYLLSTMELTKLAKGVKPGINRNDVYALNGWFPELVEQQRIVAILDEVFASIANARANAEQNLCNARELLEAVEQSLFPSGAQLEVQGRPLDELCELIVDCEHKTAPTQEDGIPSIRTPNIGRGRLILDGIYRVSDDTYKAWTRRAEPRPGDLVLAREAPAGNVAVIPGGLKVCLGQRTVLIRAKSSIFEPAYLAHFLLQRDSQQRLLAHSRGATVQHVNLKDIRAFKVSAIPSLEIQRRVVREVLALLEYGDKLESIYQQKLAALDELKQSLLARAFAGDL